MRKNELPTRREKYLEHLNRKQCSIIIKTRSRMMPVKTNHGNNNNPECRMCGQANESQQHVIEECPVTKNNGNSITYTEIFNNKEVHEMKTIAEKLMKIEETLKKDEKKTEEADK